MMSRMYFVLLVQVAVVASTESCLAGDAECASDSSVLIQKTVVTAHSFDAEDDALASFSELFHSRDGECSCTEGCGDWPSVGEIAPKWPNSMTLTTVVSIDGVEQDKGVLAAFIDGEIHGIAIKPLKPPFGPHKGDPFYHLMVFGGGMEAVGGNPQTGQLPTLVHHSADGKKITYKFRACDGTVTELEHEGKYDFKTDDAHGSVVKKIVLKPPTPPPPCENDQDGLNQVLRGWGMPEGSYTCDRFKAMNMCLGLREVMEEHCLASCKDIFHRLPGYLKTCS